MVLVELGYECDLKLVVYSKPTATATASKPSVSERVRGPDLMLNMKATRRINSAVQSRRFSIQKIP
ncbi:hypothetical protein PILCRDRAFT_830067 [Piloderma croceum F 1598]|uniref:Uncharacterized protein n=1 Tax=Piloderma croceum (strain F 1598) TaxID=765440 RepID=A0A0C3EVS8_PILCF|nr:hypothetical protein PILCRDRAFT_830067 [Piloderma croceum F 1598]